MKTFFIAGVQRSGTTLLSVMLGNHPDILLERRSIAFRLITCFRNMYDLLPHNLEVDEKEFLEWLIENDIGGRLAELINTENITNGGTIRSLITASIDEKLTNSRRKMWGDKSPNVQHFINDLLLLIPEAKILHIVRDGRATALSMHKRAGTNLQFAAQQWVEGNIFGLVNQSILGEKNYKIIRYEDLLQQPESIMRSICTFLEIPFADQILSPVDIGMEGREKYVAQQIDISKIDQWKDELKEGDLKKIERIQAPMLKKFEYELINKKINYRPLSNRRRIFLNQKDNFKRLFVSEKTVMVDKELVPLKISLRSRGYNFLRVLAQDLLPDRAFKSIFSQVFYKKKFYQPKNRKAKEKITS